MKLKIGNQKGKINETKSWLFEKVNKINKPLARLAKKTHIIYIRWKQKSTVDVMKIKRIIMKYHDRFLL